MTGKLLLATILCLMGGSALGDDVLEGTYNVTAFCTAVKTGTQLGSIESCQTYYVCTSTGPQKSSCQDGYSYDLAKSSCYPSSQVNCYWGLDNPCTGRDKVWVPNTSVCGGYYYCTEGTCSPAKKCATNQVFDSTTQACKWGSCNGADSTATEGTVLSTPCDVVPPGIWFGDTEACDIWYKCESSSTGVTLKNGVCGTAMPAFNPQAQNCGYKTAAICSRVTGNPISNVATSCTTADSKKADPLVCNQYSECVSGTWTKLACATGYYYDVNGKKCVLRQDATPVATCNRCLFAQTMFVNAVDSDNCSKYLYCPEKGDPTETPCPEDHYFNESLSGCAPDSGLKEYVGSNGACLGASVDGATTEADEATTADPKE
ncbi:LOW QUALITY PROTEIN: peritrophin-48 [Drosophila rhopaloa]|uniref:Chitin-binding type-2 domain-containing protein n=1 Tax=Drosophila rhopaloa TaxID=1041015 RepID=A0ABM5I6Z7_DRORH|nr:LOW QUALITY PROTEIN: peritrophin-48 [Drosophila rhopaloa]